MRRIARLFLVSLGTAILLSLTAIVGAANLADERLRLAAQIASFDARVQMRLADEALKRPGADPARSGGVEHARAAVVREPALAPAWRLLALANEFLGDRDKAEVLYRHSERLSRRHLPTQLWLMSDALARNDVPRAIDHQDIAMRTNPSSISLLVPLMVLLVDQERAQSHLATVLSRMPPWWPHFFDQWIAVGPQPQTAVRLVTALRERGALPTESAQLDRLVRTLIERNAPLEAFYIEALRGRFGSASSTIRNAAFDQNSGPSAFDWQFPNPSGIVATIEGDTVNPTNQLLNISVAGDAFGTAATQLLLLQPGVYRLRVVSARTAGEPRASVVIRCVRGSGNPLLRAPLALSASTRKELDQTFTVETNCVSQTLSVILDGGGAPGGSAFWLDDFVIEQSSGSDSGRL